MLKKYNHFIKESKEQQRIKDVCDAYHIRHWELNDNGEVDVKAVPDDPDAFTDGDVLLTGYPNKNHIKFDEIPFKFGKVDGNFACQNNNLESLKGSPHTVGIDFNCSNNKLHSLEGGPKVVGGDYTCKFNVYLHSLDGCAEKIGGSLTISGNKLKSLKGCPDELDRLNCDSCELTSFEGAPTTIKKGITCEYNNIKSFIGFPTNIPGYLHLGLTGNPIEEVYELFKDVRFIEHINEWDVIDPEDMTISYSRLMEACETGDIEPIKPEDIKLEHYTVIDL